MLNRRHKSFEQLWLYTVNVVVIDPDSLPLPTAPKDVIKTRERVPTQKLIFKIIMFLEYNRKQFDL
ncbi:MAG: hypothetical protein EAZ32_03155 [Cytophagia bacterium]|nr:MAG: hypothetical protein EAZ38_05950 [Cytophagales bacterium]TAG41354.1 MAG: hypothetical protein EAZ32_03155 [Cytophagia bacterium]TAG83112.1 MAG: hypothetical protein EAZ22_03525 [Cytophagales bacterium]